MFYMREENPTIANIEERIAQWVMIDKNQGEGLQVLFYKVCRPHAATTAQPSRADRLSGLHNRHSCTTAADERPVLSVTQSQCSLQTRLHFIYHKLMPGAALMLCNV